MTIEIWSDVACPWCYIGKRRFERALERFAHRDSVEVVWRSFQLDPAAPATSDMPVVEMLATKKGMPIERAEAMTRQVTGIAAEEGLEYHMERATYANTFDAHRLIHFAAKHGRQDAMKERLLRGYFSEGAKVGDHETLVRLATEIGLPLDEVRAMLASDELADDVRSDFSRGASFGIRGVPFFVIDETYGVSGAQPAEAMLEVLDEAWSKSHPLETVGATGDAGMCDDGSCELPSREDVA